MYLDVNDNRELDRGTDHFVGETNGQGAPNGSTYYKIMAKTGQTFTPGEAITLVITANNHNGNADNTIARVLITIQPATSGQNAAETPGYGPLDYGDDPNPLPGDNLGLLSPDIS